MKIINQMFIGFVIALITLSGSTLYPAASFVSGDNITTEHIHLSVEIVDSMPISEHIREFDMSKTGGVWRATDGPSYITPDHEVVQWFARNTILNETGLYYIDDKLVRKNYHPDINYENENHWMNADYYLSHELGGDCEDFAIGIASILEAKGIPNMVIAISDRRTYAHCYLEYFFEGEYYIADTKHETYRPRGQRTYEYPKVWMFNINKDYCTYNEDWIEIH